MGVQLNRFLKLGVLSRVVDALVDHFLSFKKEQRQLPVVWHQSLLCFVQRWQLLALALNFSPSDFSPGAGLTAPPVLPLPFKDLSKRPAAERGRLKIHTLASSGIPLLPFYSLW